VKTGSSDVKRLSGVFTRGKVFWFRYSHNGHQYRVSLDTTSESEVIAKAMGIRENSVLAHTDTLKREIKAYVEQSNDPNLTSYVGFTEYDKRCA
jgi:hypothetical protein